jgi:hypothetical protein
MTLNQLDTLSEDELAIALYIVNHISPLSIPKMELGPINLTWFKHDMLVKKLLDAFPKVKPEGHVIYSSLLKKLGVEHEIKYEQAPLPVTASVPITASAPIEEPITASAPVFPVTESIVQPEVTGSI